MMKENSSSGRVFGRQKGKKLSKRQSGNFERYLPIFSIFPTKKDGSYDFTSESLHKIFRTKSHVELELGFGMGDFLVEKAFSNSNLVDQEAVPEGGKSQSTVQELIFC